METRSKTRISATSQLKTITPYLRRWIIQAVSQAKENGITPAGLKMFLNRKEAELGGRLEVKMMIKKLSTSGHIVKRGSKFFIPSSSKTQKKLTKKVPAKQSQMQNWITKALASGPKSGLSKKELKAYLEEKKKCSSTLAEVSLILDQLMNKKSVKKSGEKFKYAAPQVVKSVKKRDVQGEASTSSGICERVLGWILPSPKPEE